MKYVFYYKNGKQIEFEQEVKGNEEAIKEINSIIQTALQEDCSARVTLSNGDESLMVKMSEVTSVSIKELN